MAPKGKTKAAKKPAAPIAATPKKAGPSRAAQAAKKRSPAAPAEALALAQARGPIVDATIDAKAADKAHKERRAALVSTMEKNAIGVRAMSKSSGVAERAIRRCLEKGFPLTDDDWVKLAQTAPLGSALRKLFGVVLNASDIAPAKRRPAGVIYVPFNLLRENPENYRRTYDAEAIDQLAASISAEGLLQNLVVFPGDDNGVHTVNSGNRRYRALKQLVEAEEFAVDYPVPVLIKEMSAAEGLALAIVENLQRQDVNPLEEADGFRSLRELGWGTEQIAQTIGVAQRTVQDRLQLSECLFEAAREALTSKQITLDQARAIVTAPTEALQAEMLNWATHEYHPFNAEQLRAKLREGLPSISVAGFDLKLYEGPYVGEGKNRLFADVDAFNELQAVAAVEKMEELGKVWSKATLLPRNENFQYWNYVDEPDPAKGEAFVWIDRRTRAIATEEGVVRKPNATAPTGEAGSEAAAAKKAAEEQREAEHLALAGRYREALVASPVRAMRVSVLNALCSFDIDMACLIPLHCNSAAVKRVRELLDMPDLLTPRPGVPGDEMAGFNRGGIEDFETLKAVWLGLNLLHTDYVLEIVAQIITEDVGEEWEWGGVPPADQMVLATLGIEVPPSLLAPDKPAAKSGARDDDDFDDAEDEPEQDGDGEFEDDDGVEVDEFTGTDEEAAHHERDQGARRSFQHLPQGSHD